MTTGRKKLLVVDVAALSGAVDGLGMKFHLSETVFPAVTCPVQASFRTATTPGEHGMGSNGIYRRDLRRLMFWEQSAALVSGERIWSGFRRRGGTVGMLFWQQSLGEDVDLVLSPAPIHKHHGGMIEDCYCQPAGLYDRLCSAVGGRFKLRHYWGPLASAKAGDWIAAATTALLVDDAAPDLLLTYLPTLDYDLQRYGPESAKAAKALDAVAGQLNELRLATIEHGYEMLVFGDYCISDVEGPTYPNRALAEAGLLKTRPVKGMLYPDLHASRAFAMVDHQIAHVYAASADDAEAAREVLSELPGVATVMDTEARGAAGIDHANAGELVLLAEPGTWFAYPWWTHRRQAPDYAGHVDIHNKPGYDPCELFFGWPPGSVSQDAGRIRGSHGLTGPGREVAWATTLPLAEQPETLIDLARLTRTWLDENE